MTTLDGIVFLQGCLAGKGEGGTALLNRLSLELRPRKIVGFSTIGFESVEKQRRDGEACREPALGTRTISTTVLHRVASTTDISKMVSGMIWADFLGNPRLRPTPKFRKMDVLSAA